MPSSAVLVPAIGVDGEVDGDGAGQRHTQYAPQMAKVLTVDEANTNWQ
jgi:hypothetical protein